MLELDSVDSFYETSHILHDISLTVQEGNLIALLGRNGAGKTTTIKTIMGLVPDIRGTVEFKGTEIQGMNPNKISQMGISLIPERRRLFHKLTVRENLEMGHISHDMTETVDERIQSIFEYFPKLAEMQDRKANQLSGGEQQMVSIGRGLMPSPDLLLVDEPTEGLMPTLVEKFQNDLTDINNNGTTIILVEQNADVALEISDYAYIIDEGVIVSEGPSEQLREDEEIQSRYLSV